MIINKQWDLAQLINPEISKKVIELIIGWIGPVINQVGNLVDQKQVIIKKHELLLKRKKGELNHLNHNKQLVNLKLKDLK